MSNDLKKNTLFTAICLGLAFICYLGFVIAFTINYGAVTSQWVILAFLFVFGTGFYIGFIKKNAGMLSKYCLIVLLIGNIVVSLIMDAVKLFPVVTNVAPAYLAYTILSGIAGLLCLFALVFFVLGFSFADHAALFQKITRILFVVIGFLYLGAGICYDWMGDSYWLMFGLYTAAFVYCGFYYAVPVIAQAVPAAKAE